MSEKQYVDETIHRGDIVAYSDGGIEFFVNKYDPLTGQVDIQPRGGADKDARIGPLETMKRNQYFYVERSGVAVIGDTAAAEHAHAFRKAWLETVEGNSAEWYNELGDGDKIAVNALAKAMFIAGAAYGIGALHANIAASAVRV